MHVHSLIFALSKQNAGRIIQEKVFRQFFKNDVNMSSSNIFYDNSEGD